MRKTWAIAIGVAAAAALIVPTGVNAAVDAFRLQDADSQNKAQVDKGELRVGDGDGPVTVDGTVGVSGNVDVAGDVGIDGRVSSTDATLLIRGDCDETSEGDLGNIDQLPTGTTITDIVFTMDTTTTARSTLVVRAPSVPGFIANPDPLQPQQRASGKFMALAVGWTQGYADFNETVSYGDGVRLEEPWHFYCTGVVGSGQGDGLWSVYGYE